MPALSLHSTLHSRLASEHAQLKDELEAVRQDNIQLVREHNHVKQVCEELRRLHEDDQREVADMRMLHQQVLCCSATVALLLQTASTLSHLHAPFLCRQTVKFHLSLLYLEIGICKATFRETLPDKLFFIDHNVLPNRTNGIKPAATGSDY